MLREEVPETGPLVAQEPAHLWARDLSAPLPCAWLPVLHCLWLVGVVCLCPLPYPALSLGLTAAGPVEVPCT